MTKTKAILLCLLFASCTKETEMTTHNLLKIRAEKIKEDKKDKEPPVIVITAPTSDSAVMEGDIRFQGSVSDNQSLGEYLLTVTDSGGTDWAWFTNEWEDPENPPPHPKQYVIDEIQNLPAGSYTIHGHANDSSGHMTLYESQFHVLEAK
jgi:methionine-rich copper-binding protein CopC